MLLARLINALRIAHISPEPQSNAVSNTLTIKGSHEKIGDVVIEEDGGELIVIVGNFTHWHAACYDETLNDSEKEEQIVAEVCDFLMDLTTDKIVLWGSHDSGGGFYYPDFNLDEQDAPLDSSEVDKYVWSGKKIS